MERLIRGSRDVGVLSKPTALRAVLLSGVVAVVWMGLAWRSPTLTYHFAPLIGGVVGPLSLRSQGRADAALTQKVGGIVLAMLGGVTLLLELAGRQEGPNFLHSGPAWPEAVLFAVVGVAIGVRAASRERPGLLGSLVEPDL